MPQIPDEINGVKITFEPSVNREVDQKLIDGLVHAIPPADRVPLRPYSLHVYSASDKHKWPSRHSNSLVVRWPMFKAVDISRVNGVRMAAGYGRDSFLTQIVQQIQRNFETFQYRRENYGPYIKKKLGKPRGVTGHGDHIHLSVN